MRARRTDANHEAIAKAFEGLGCRVHRTNADWDLTVCYGREVELVEVKNEKTQYGRKGLSKRQQELPIQPYLVRNLDDVEECVKSLRRRYFLVCMDALG